MLTVIRNIESYEAVTAAHISLFNELVNKKLKEGYHFYGEPFIINDQMVQPMVKYSSDKLQ